MSLSPPYSFAGQFSLLETDSEAMRFVRSASPEEECLSDPDCVAVLKECH